MRRAVRVAVASLLTAVAGTAIPPAAHADDPTPLTRTAAQQFLDDQLPALLEEFEIPGAAAVIVADGEQAAAAGYGVADVESGTPVDPESTLMFTGSVAKAFTATAAMQLVEAGQLDLDLDVNDYLTTLQVPDTYPGRPITMRHLLTHTGGFDYAVLGAGAAEPGDETLSEHLVARLPSRVRPPGEVVSYDNYGVALAGLVVEEIAGEPFAQYLKSHVFDPVGMSSASAQAPLDGVAHGYRVSHGEQVRTYGQYGALAPTGAGVVASATDMGRYMLAQLDPAPSGILEAATIEEMQAHQAGLDERLPGIGLIWERRTHGDTAVVVKDGDIPGFHSNLVLLPEHDAGLYVVFNGDGAGNSAWLAARRLEAAFVGEFFGTDAPEGGTWDADLDEYVGSYRGAHVSRSDLLGASGFVGGIEVEAGDGILITHDPMAEDPDHETRTWTPTAPGLFRADDGDLLAIDLDSGMLAMSDMPSFTWQRVAWYQAPAAQQSVAATGLGLVLVSGGIGLVGLLRRRDRARWPRAARLTTWVATLATIGYVTAFLAMMGDGAAVNQMLLLGDSPMLIVVRVLSSLALVGALASGVLAVVGWVRGWSGRGSRVLWTTAALGLVVSLAVFWSHHLLGPGLW